MKRALFLVGLFAFLTTSSCAYFNSLYNAKRLYSDAERAAERGDSVSASQHYRTSIEKAARSLEKDPDGRWSDDALYLIARAHFQQAAISGRGLDRAGAAFRRLLEVSEDDDMRAGAHAYLGAVEYRLGNIPGALEQLDRSLEVEDGEHEMASFAHLWRARARFAGGDPAGAWSDLDAAVALDDRVRVEAGLESLARALSTDESSRFQTALGVLASDENAASSADSIAVLARRSAQRWGAASAREFLESFAGVGWSPAAREEMTLLRAELAVEAGDTATGIADANAIARASAESVGLRARVAAAEWQLASVSDPAELEDIRAPLLSALERPEAARLVRELKTLEVLLGRGEEGQQLAYFAAAELARDQLGAPALARTLFLRHAESSGGTEYTGKSLLAAASLNPSPDQAGLIDSRIEGLDGNVYLAAANGGVDDAEYGRAERSLERQLALLMEHAYQEAEERDGMVSQTLAEIDSVSEMATVDSLIAACALMVDSVAQTGTWETDDVLADSARVACVRTDTARLDSILNGELDFAADTAAADTLFDDGDDPFPPDSADPFPPDTSDPFPDPPDSISMLLEPAG